MTEEQDKETDEAISKFMESKGIDPKKTITIVQRVEHEPRHHKPSPGTLWCSIAIAYTESLSSSSKNCIKWANEITDDYIKRFGEEPK